MTRTNQPRSFGGRLPRPDAVNGLVAPLSRLMNWNNVYRAVSYLRASLWIVPIVAVALALESIRVLTIDYSARLLRPVRIVALACDEGMDVVRGV